MRQPHQIHLNSPVKSRRNMPLPGYALLVLTTGLTLEKILAREVNWQTSGTKKSLSARSQRAKTPKPMLVCSVSKLKYKHPALS